MIHNQLTNYAQLLAGFRRALGEMGPNFSGIERAGETLTPTIDLWSLPEWALARGEQLFARDGISQGAGGAGVFSSEEFVNPAGSGVLAVILEIFNSSSNVFVGVDNGPALGAVATARGVNLDARIGTNLGELSRCTIVTGQLAGGVALPVDLILQNTRSVRPYILPPGRKLFVSPGANQASAIGFFWSERPLLPAEQNGQS